MLPYPEFSKLLRKYLSEQDRTQAWLANRINLHPGTVNRWLEQLTRPSSPEVVIRIADVLGVLSGEKRQALLAAAGYGYQDGTKYQQTEHLEKDNFAQLSGHLLPRPILVPAIPTQGVFGREDVLQQAVAMLQVDSAAQVLPPIAFQGMGGIGKTTLAVVFGQDTLIQNHFTDGILWVALGPNPVIRLLLHDWGRALGLDLEPERDENACRERLQILLHHRRVLLIIDDVWEVGHAQYFLVGGPYCRTLITTRETPIAYTLATQTRTIKVDVLKADAALSLLSNLAPEAVNRDRKGAKLLCQRLECLPLAITLAGRLLANETDVPSRMQRLLQELLERRSARLQLVQEEGRIGLNENSPVSLHAILGMSVVRLSLTDQERFALLAVFGSEPLTWQVDAVAHVWDCPMEDAEATISRFIQRGLVTYRSVQNDYWVHALLADYASEMMEQQGNE